MSPDETQPPADAAADPAPAAPPEKGSGWAQTKADLKWATPLLLFAILGLSGLLHGPWNVPTAGTEDLANVTDAIFSSGNHSPDMTPAARAAAGADPRETGLLVPFEILSALLLAALVAGIVIALRERDGDL